MPAPAQGDPAPGTPSGTASIVAPGAKPDRRAKPGRWADLRLRVASAAVLAPVALLCVWFGGPPWAALVALAALCLGIEWADMCRTPARSWPGILVPAAALAAAALAGAGRPGLALALVAAACPLAALAGGRWTALGIAYIGIPVVALSVVRAGPGGWAGTLFLLLAVWASDIGAYAVGRIVGGPRLAPAISPGKTRSGAVGGLLLTTLLGAALAPALATPLAPIPWTGAAAVAAVLSVASQAGDLFESWVKRRFGVKDSGRLIPGHGGVLDRLDGLLTAAPAMALVTWAAHGGPGAIGVFWR